MYTGAWRSERTDRSPNFGGVMFRETRERHGVFFFFVYILYFTRHIMSPDIDYTCSFCTLPPPPQIKTSIDVPISNKIWSPRRVVTVTHVITFFRNISTNNTVLQWTCENCNAVSVLLNYRIVVFVHRYYASRSSRVIGSSDIKRDLIEIQLEVTWNGTQVMDERSAMISFAFSRKPYYYWLCCLLTVIVVRPAHTSK